MGEPSWYYVERGESIGPVDEATIRQRVRDGLLNRDSLVWKDGMPEWTHAGEAAGLMPPPIPKPSPPTPPPVPQSQQAINGGASVAPESPQGEAPAFSEPSPPGHDVYLPPSKEVIDLDAINPVAPPQSPAGDDCLSYAGFWKRLAGLVIDYIIMFAAMFALFFALGLLLASGGAMDTYSAEDWEAIGNCCSFLAFWLYFAGMESSRHQGTLGKMALGIKVTDLSGQPIGFGRACGRHFSKIISGIILGIGYLIAAFTPKKQALHDMIAGCLVVNK